MGQLDFLFHTLCGFSEIGNQLHQGMVSDD